MDYDFFAWQTLLDGSVTADYSECCNCSYGFSSADTDAIP